MSKTRRKAWRGRALAASAPARQRQQHPPRERAAVSVRIWPWLALAELPRERKIAFGVLGSVLFIGLAIRVWLSVNDDGIYWPDEIFQSLEPAHRLVFGYGLYAWEFVDGARNWAFPAFVAALFEV